MALMKADETARESVYERFGIAQDGFIPDDIEERKEFQRQLRESIYVVAKTLNSQVADSREKSLAITKLEEALMWGGKAIFA